MSIIRAIFEDGVLKPTVPLDLPNKAEVEVEVKVVAPVADDLQVRQERGRRELFEILSRSYETGDPDLAARHNEHQP